MSGEWTAADREAARLLRGRIIRTLHRSPPLSQEVLHATVCGGPRDEGYVKMDVFADHLIYLQDRGYLTARVKTDPLHPEDSTCYWRLSPSGVDLFQGVILPDPGIHITR